MKPLQKFLQEQSLTEMQKELSSVRSDLQNDDTLVMDHDQKLIMVMEQLTDTVRKSELSPIMLDFSREEVQLEFLFLDGQPMKADAAYISIYSQAKKSVHIVDDYIATKTLHLLQDIQDGVDVTIFSDNTYNKLAASDYQRQFPGRMITFKQTMNKAHDRFIVLDYGTDDERAFHCGPSSKDAGKKFAAITEFSEGDMKTTMHDVITRMLGNPDLVLMWYLKETGIDHICGHVRPFRRNMNLIFTWKLGMRWPQCFKNWMLTNEIIEEGYYTRMTVQEDLFPAILREKMKNGEFVFPTNTEYEYSPITAYRCYFRNAGDESVPNREDFRSHAELGRVLRGNGSSKAEYYGTSLFTSLGALNNIQSLNKPEKRVAVGNINQESGPISRNDLRCHICWWLYENADLSSFEEVKADG